MTRDEAIAILKDYKQCAKEIYHDDECYTVAFDMAIEALSEPTEFEWCTDCKEYDQEQHCCHRWTKQIRKTIEDIKEQYAEDYVEVIRCKDCRHRYEEGDCTHYYWCRLNDRPIDDTDFCSWAERRE